MTGDVSTSLDDWTAHNESEGDMRDPDGWTRTENGLPPDGVLVETKIEDMDGLRNVQMLRRSGRLWFIPGGPYVYYEPTHWRPDTGREGT
jgi:hypothetical protein